MQKPPRPLARVKRRVPSRVDHPEPQRTAAIIRQELGDAARFAIVLGSGFQPVLAAARHPRSVPYRDLPGFAVPAVPHHDGRLVAALFGDLPVLFLSGRVHYYEGFDLATVTFPIRVLAELGIRGVLLTNAAGAIHPRFQPGELMIIRDHLNFMGTNPLRGPVPNGRQRFVDLSRVYDPGFHRGLQAAAKRERIRLRQGTYLAVAGPSYETPAEIRAFARWGADAVGMSTVPEAIVARQCGLRVAGLSCLTNLAAGRTEYPLSHAEVLAAGNRAAEPVVRLLTCWAGMLSTELRPSAGDPRAAI